MRNQVTHVAEIWKGYIRRASEEMGLARLRKAWQWNLPRVTRSGKLSAIFISSRNFAKWEVETRSRYEEGKRWKSQRLVHANLSHSGVPNRQKITISKIYLIEFHKKTLLINKSTILCRFFLVYTEKKYRKDQSSWGGAKGITFCIYGERTQNISFYNRGRMKVVE